MSGTRTKKFILTNLIQIFAKFAGDIYFLQKLFLKKSTENESILSTVNMKFKVSHYGRVHRCGLGGSMRACHAAGPGSIPSRDKFPG